jgi:hypothetical protein
MMHRPTLITSAEKPMTLQACSAIGDEAPAAPPA